MAKTRRPLFQSVRSRIIVGGSIWIIMMTVLGTYAVSLTFAEGYTLRDVRLLNEQVYTPTEQLVTALQAERQLSVRFVGGEGTAVYRALDEQRVATDDAVTAFRTSVASGEVTATASEALTERIDDVLSRLSEIGQGRVAIAAEELDRARTAAMFTHLIDAAFRIYDALPSANEPHVGDRHQALVDLQRAREVVSRESALLAGALAAGSLSPSERQSFDRLVGTQRFLFTEFAQRLEAGQQERYADLTTSESFQALRGIEDDVAGMSDDAASIPVAAGAWESTTSEVLGQLRDLELAFVDDMLATADAEADALFLRGTMIIVLGLVFVLGMMTVWLLVAPRYVTRQLTALKKAALQLADERLPRVVEQLRRGEQVDVHTAAPPLEFGPDEFGQVGKAFNQVQEVAVRAAIEQTQLRSGIRDVFVNLARRSQGLVHRQLALLDEMERRTSDPDELERLFAIDHLATRMRRHAEDLIILSGSPPGRQWRKPVPMVDVVRSAVGEIEAYARVTTLPIADALLSGRVVADVIHLLAELLENAAAYSPPQTKVRVSGERVPNGFVVEIEDSGLGMPAEELARYNDRLAHPPEFHPSDTVQLGLFVVSRLAQRHGIRVHLRGSPYGGTTAIVLIPGQLIETPPGEDDEAAPAPATVTPAPGAADLVDAAPVPAVEFQPEPVQAEPVQAEPVQAQPEPPPEAHPERPPEAQPDTEPVPATTSGLPKRVRQASLADQLRETTPVAPAAPVEHPVTVRTPEQIRSMMTTFQRGSLRGRSDAQAAEGGSKPPNHRPSPRPSTRDEDR